MKDKQKEMILEAVRVHNQEVKFAAKLLSLYGVSIQPSDDILLQQIELIVEGKIFKERHE